MMRNIHLYFWGVALILSPRNQTPATCLRRVRHLGAKRVNAATEPREPVLERRRRRL